MSTSAATATSNSSTSAGSTPNASQAALTSNYSTFLTLLTTQLQNQDPLDPMDSSQFTNQLVLFSQVEQQIQTNAQLTTLISDSNANTTQQALSYIGLDVTATGNSFNYDGSDSVNLGYTIPSTAASSTVSVTNAAGVQVWSENGQTAAGNYTATWNGTDSSGNALAAGTYTVAVTAVDSTGTPLSTTTTVPGQVTGVSTTNGTTYLTINGAAVPLSSVTSASYPGTSTSTSTGA
jgi:flagellar basal-body rod modification protein FlgD